MTHVDLFSGIGGFALACRWAGIKTVAFCEIDPFCQKVLEKNFDAEVVADTPGTDAGSGEGKQEGCEPIDRKSAQLLPDASHTGRGNGAGNHNGRTPIYPDIFTFPGHAYPNPFILTGGFPCQPFSCAGKRKGKDDDRHLWPQMLRVISEARPRWVIGENVAGIIKMELDNCISDLEGLSYSVQVFVSPACAVDAPHRRDRVWIVGKSNEFGFQEQGIRPMDKESEQRGQDVADADAKGLERYDDGESTPISANIAGANIRASDLGNGSCRWLPEPNVGRVAHGVPKRVDRLKSLGNAIVPQVAYEIIKTIREVEERGE